jgi:8-amino-7-oxononanoate synthase
MTAEHLDSTRDLCSRHGQPALAFECEHIHPALERRREVGSLRRLSPYHHENTIDFSSNDYLGLAVSKEQNALVDQVYNQLPRHSLGATGSRLLTGDSDYAQTLERRLAKWHKRPAALLCNSGYDANLSVLSSLTMNCCVILDELCHNSIQMGVRLSKGCNVSTFLHNSIADLERILREKTAIDGSTRILVVVESVYSMDGDQAPLANILETAREFNACVIVDEAHGLGVLGHDGMGLLSKDGLENHPSLLCSVHTFGKAAGCHGAVVCGSSAIREYLYNYGRPIVYSTSLPLHSLVAIACAYRIMSSEKGRHLRTKVAERVQRFRKNMLKILSGRDGSISLGPSSSPIQALILPGNTACIDFCNIMSQKSGKRILLYPIRSPTVPKGQERIRIILHSHNTTQQVDELTTLIDATLAEVSRRQTSDRYNPLVSRL